MEPHEIDEVMNNHYRVGSTPRLIAALRHLCDRDAAGTTPELRAPFVAFFGAAARKDPEVASRIRALRGDTPTGSPLVDEILRAVDHPPPHERVRTGADLDLRWSEFFATGDLGPLREIVAVLAWKDLVRARVEALLGERRWSDALFGAARRRAEVARRLGPCGIRVDPQGAAVLNAADLDCVTIMRGLVFAPEKIKRLQKALPTPLGQDELMHVATKTAALRSLGSNAPRHPPVLDACVEALELAEGPARLSLQTIVCHARLARGELADAVAVAEAALSLDPEEASLIELRARAREEVSLAAARALLDAGSETGEELPDPVALRQRAGATAPPGYRVVAQIRAEGSPGNPRRDGLVAEWDVAFCGDRSSGERWFWDPESAQALADLWVTIGAAHYENPGLWVRFPDGQRDGEQNALRRERITALLAGAPDAAERRVRPEGNYVALRYVGAEIPALAPVVEIPGTRCRMTLWLREEDAALVAASLWPMEPTAGSEARALLRVVFLYDNTRPEIEAPEEFIDARDGWRQPSPSN